MSSDSTMELRDYLRVLRRRRLVIVLTVLVAVGAAVGISLLQTPVYRATAEVLVEESSAQQVSDPNASRPVNVQQAVETELEFLESRTVRDAVRDELGHTPRLFADEVGTSEVIAVSVESTDAKEAARDAEVYANTYIDIRSKQSIDDLERATAEVEGHITDLQTQINALPATDARRASLETQQDTYRQQLDEFQVAIAALRGGGPKLIGKPDVPESPVRPNPLRNGLLALGLGLVLGIGLAFARDYLDDSLKTKEDLERAATDIPVLALVPAVGSWRDRKSAYLVTSRDPTSPSAEAYRTLRASLQFMALERPLQVVQITSAGPGEGKTTTLANLAMTFAHAGQRVILLDCDLRRPRLHEFFELDGELGLTSVLLGEARLAEALQPVDDQPRVAVLGSGPAPADPAELLSLPRTRELVGSLREHCDVVLVDSPPVLPVSDPLFVAGFADATLLVAQVRQTTGRSLRRALELLRQVDAPVVGTVFNGVGERGGYEYGYAPTYGRRYTGTYGRPRSTGPKPEPPVPNGDRRRLSRRDRVGVPDDD